MQSMPMLQSNANFGIHLFVLFSSIAFTVFFLVVARHHSSMELFIGNSTTYVPTSHRI